MASVKRIILASKSPFRRQLLATTGLIFAADQAPVDEYATQNSDPQELARQRSEAKAMAMARTVEAADSLVIGADQVLSLDGEAFDKVTTLAEARTRLQRLAGKTHILHTGMALALGSLAGQPARLLVSRVIDIKMPMRQLDASQIEAYLATGEWEGSVGCYQFENRGVNLFKDVWADGAAIVGLPLQTLQADLRQLGINALVKPHPPWDIVI